MDSFSTAQLQVLPLSFPRHDPTRRPVVDSTLADPTTQEEPRAVQSQLPTTASREGAGPGADLGDSFEASGEGGEGEGSGANEESSAWVREKGEGEAKKKAAD